MNATVHILGNPRGTGGAKRWPVVRCVRIIFALGILFYALPTVHFVYCAFTYVRTDGIIIGFRIERELESYAKDNPFRKVSESDYRITSYSDYEYNTPSGKFKGSCMGDSDSHAPKGGKIAVYYSPRNHSKSLGSNPIVSAIFSLFGVLVMTAIYIGIGRIGKSKISQATGLAPVPTPINSPSIPTTSKSESLMETKASEFFAASCKCGARYKVNIVNKGKSLACKACGGHFQA